MCNHATCNKHARRSRGVSSCLREADERSRQWAKESNPTMVLELSKFNLVGVHLVVEQLRPIHAFAE